MCWTSGICRKGQNKGRILKILASCMGDVLEMMCQAATAQTRVATLLTAGKQCAIAVTWSTIKQT